MARFKLPPFAYNRQDFMEILTDIDQRLQDVERAYTDQNYTVANNTTNRTIDPTTATTAQTAQVLATLISDLKTVGRLP